MSLLPSQIACCAAYYDTAATTLPGESCPSWITRGAHFVVVVSRVRDADVLVRADNPDEYVLLVPDVPGVDALVEAGPDSVMARQDSLTIVPPGASRITVQGEGVLARIFSSDAADVLARAGNAGAYAQPSPDIAPFAAWPSPADGFRLRHYRLAEHVTPGSTMRIFRTSKLMVNPILTRQGARDIRKVTPHSHADFEQVSLALGGTYVHHLRYPWGPDMTAWRDDEAVQMDSPSLVVIPPRVVHTSRSISEGPAILVDIFAPPRSDFERKGMVRNAAEYPAPQESVQP